MTYFEGIRRNQQWFQYRDKTPPKKPTEYNCYGEPIANVAQADPEYLVEVEDDYNT